MNRYDYHLPDTLHGALALKAETPAARFIAGGTDLMVQMDQGRFDDVPALISLRRVAPLQQIEINDLVRIGAAVPLSEIAQNEALRELYPALTESIDVLGSWQIRNVATLGGNLCNASPAADTAPPLIAYGAWVEVQSSRGSRTLPVEHLLNGPGKVALEPDEMVTAVVLDRPASDLRSTFIRKGRVRMDLALASVAAACRLSGGVGRDLRLVAGAVAPTPVRLRQAEKVLEGTSLDGDALAQACELALEDIAPIDDVRTTARYRRSLIRVFVRRAVERLTGGTP